MIYAAIAKKRFHFDPGKKFKISFINILYCKYSNKPREQIIKRSITYIPIFLQEQGGCGGYKHDEHHKHDKHHIKSNLT